MNRETPCHVQPLLISLGVYVLLHVIFLSVTYSSLALPGLVLAVPYVTVFGVGLLAGHLADAWHPAQLFCLGILIAAVHGIANFAAATIGLPTDLSGLLGSLLISVFSTVVVVPLTILGGGFARIMASDPKL